MSLEADLAMLRRWTTREDERILAAGRVEAEIARLQAEAKHGERAWEQMRERAEKAEAENARLRDGLRTIGCIGGHFCPGNDSFLGDVYDEGDHDPARWPLCGVCALLSGEDGAA